MNKHWKNLERKLGSKLLQLRDETIYDLIHELKMLPNWRARWCTRILKIEVAQEFYLEHLPATIYVGLRADEATRKGNKLFDDNIKQRFPLQDWGWGIDEVLNYLDKKNVKIPIRTDCAMCFYQRIGEWWNLWKYYRKRFDKIDALEKEIGHTLMSPGKFKNWPHALCDLRKEFSKGRIPRGTMDSDVGKCRVCTL